MKPQINSHCQQKPTQLFSLIATNSIVVIDEVLVVHATPTSKAKTRHSTSRDQFNRRRTEEEEESLSAQRQLPKFIFTEDWLIVLSISIIAFPSSLVDKEFRDISLNCHQAKRKKRKQMNKLSRLWRGNDSWKNVSHFFFPDFLRWHWKFRFSAVRGMSNVN